MYKRQVVKSGVGFWAFAFAVLGAACFAGAVVAAVAWILAIAVVAAVAGAWTGAVARASEELFESVGKEKATMILFATGFAALGVALLVKVLFVR